ncbi:uncharacterized protein PG998_003771 [Apiospora kogelbergensis]|uniref:uncharacterized protein n=1 Tax=Apiospora kogelbergensis TaxID=1337665 RepID=UPI00312F4559
MKQRRTHYKSRNGCYSCKQKHVKCDEQGPPCANCVLRGAECTYPTPGELEEARLRRQTAFSTTRTGPKETKGSRKGRLPSSFPNLAPAAPKLVPSPSPPPLSGEPVYNSRLELELMHQWTTKTWMGFYEIPEDQRYLQEELPRTALQEGYLLNGILAIAATDLAHQAEVPVSSKYIHAALGYGNRASIRFLQELSRLAATNNSHVLYHSGIVVERRNSRKGDGVIRNDTNGGPTSKQDHADKALQRFNVSFDLLLGDYNNLLTHIKWTTDDPSGIRDAVDRLRQEPLTLDLVSLDTRLAMERLTSVCQHLRADWPPSHSNGDAAAAPLSYLSSKMSVHRLAISQTKLSYVIETLDLPKGFACRSSPQRGLVF